MILEARNISTHNYKHNNNEQQINEIYSHLEANKTQTNIKAFK